MPLVWLDKRQGEGGSAASVKRGNMPIFETIVDAVREQAEEEKVVEGELPYWMECPGCGKRVVKKELLSKGCYVCGWHEARDETELAKIVHDSPVRHGDIGEERKGTSYRTNCPQCKARVTRQELMERGCYICGWKPEP